MDCEAVAVEEVLGVVAWVTDEERVFVTFAVMVSMMVRVCVGDDETKGVEEKNILKDMDCEAVALEEVLGVATWVEDIVRQPLLVRETEFI